MRAPLDPDHGQHHSRSPPQARLVIAILAQAVQDAFGPISNQTPTQKRGLRHEAIDFLTAAAGSKAGWRRLYCSLAGIDADVFRESVIAILEGRRSVVLPYARKTYAEGLTEARDIWGNLRPRPNRTPPQRLPTIRPTPRLPAPLPSLGALVIPDDPCYPSRAGHICTSRRWHDGETSRYLGPLPSLHTPIGQALWAITQVSRSGYNALKNIADDPHDLVQRLQLALPTCDAIWTSKGNRLPEYQPNAGLRLYLKQLPKVA